MRIFIVEDSIIVRGRIIVMLSSIDGVSVCGMSGIVSEAIQTIKTQQPDLVIIDLKIFGGSGLEVLKSVKEDNPSIKTLILTNYPYQQYREKCKELGADYFFDKSTEFEKAFQVITSLQGGGDGPEQTGDGRDLQAEIR
jgi:two-component system, NarL family, response regulator DevR